MRCVWWMALVAAVVSRPGVAQRPVVLQGARVRVEAQAGAGATAREVFSIRSDGAWVPVLDGAGFLHVRDAAGIHVCRPEQATTVAPRPEEASYGISGLPGPMGLLVTGDCGMGRFEQRISLDPAMGADADVLHVATRLMLERQDQKVAEVRSVEDRYDFLPAKHTQVDEHTGPLDFVWSQNIKREADDLIPTHAFKAPTVMMQQGAAFAAMVPKLSERHAETRALDLDVTSGPRPWMAFGAIPSEPHDHSYFRRDAEAELPTPGGEVHYEYDLVLSAQPERMGYRRVVRLLWERMGHPALLRSADAQQNALRPELASFDSWRQDAWHTYADRVYLSFPCGGGKVCGTLASDRNPVGDWGKTQPDAWFNAWFQTLRTAYGWYVYGQAHQDAAVMAKAESVLNLALQSPRKGGAFSTIYLLRDKRWLPGDGWAGYGDSYHLFSMSWTAYWMLRWADLVPARRAEVLAFVRPYGDFLLRQQEASGNWPSWFLADSLEPREELREFNAEAGPSALLLVALAESTHDQRYLEAAERAMAYVQREVLPRERWFDFETFRSCARKPFDFFDTWTAQYPQNNLAEIQTVEAMLALYRATGKKPYLATGTAMLDYLLLTQQVWSDPEFTPTLLGGFTTQNTDAEWSDARQAYAAVVLHDYYEATGNFEYMERAVAATRSTFAVAPWENWAHTGYLNEPGSLTGFHWGTGSAMTTVELLQPEMGEAFVDVTAKRGVGVDACTMRDVRVEGNRIAFRISSSEVRRTFLLRAGHVNPKESYEVRWNDAAPSEVKGSVLAGEGLRIGPIVRESTAVTEVR